MNKTRIRCGLGLVLSTLLLLAQAAGVAHAYDHEAGAPQNQSCPLCATAAGLEAACVDTSFTTGTESSAFRPRVAPAAAFGTTRPIAVRQRGPPRLT